jgi:murein DD-endopeptidase MepM/ murein hydrolase activator NlpD
MIVHADGLATVYGHISKPLVAEEQYVTKGQNIALSGGMPGTAGAGNLTSGPHLHFEVRLNGIPVDPLNYMPK